MTVAITHRSASKGLFFAALILNQGVSVMIKKGPISVETDNWKRCELNSLQLVTSLSSNDAFALDLLGIDKKTLIAITASPAKGEVG